MSFTSLGFAVCFPILLVLYYIIPEKVKKYFLILCSGIFYVLFDYRYIFVLIGVTLVSYLFGQLLIKKRSRIIMWLGIVITLAPLALLKYVGVYQNLAAVTGISFFTLQAVSYVVDCFKKPLVSNSFVDYLLYLTYFPTIVSGPIKKYNQFANQISVPKTFDYEKIRRGLYMMAVGYIEKLMLADCAAKFVSSVFDSKELLPGCYILIATITFGLQLYFDFAGYSYIAIGASLALGYDVPDNFLQPYFATSIKEFWRRWHISLSTFLKDYVYIPLGGSRCGSARKYLNIMITFLVSGIWHGVGLNFVFWGALHGMYQVIGNLKNALTGRLKNSIVDNRLSHVAKSIIVFILVDYAWLYFRANSLTQGFEFTWQMITGFNVSSLSDRWIYRAGMNKIQLLFWVIVAVLIFVFDIFIYKKIDLFKKLASKKTLFRWIVYFCVIGIILIGYISGLGKNAGAFIYGGF